MPRLIISWILSLRFLQCCLPPPVFFFHSLYFWKTYDQLPNCQTDLLIVKGWGTNIWRCVPGTVLGGLHSWSHFISHDDPSGERLSVHRRDAEALLQEGQDSVINEGIHILILLTLTPLNLILQLKTWPESGFRHFFPHSFWERSRVARSCGEFVC